MKKYNGTLVFTMDELVDLLGGTLYNELNGADELGTPDCLPDLCGLEIVFHYNRFTPKAKEAFHDALK